MKDIKMITVKLKEIIDRNGPDYLTDEPYRVYLELMQSENVNRKIASMILYLLVNDVKSVFTLGNDPASISGAIQNRCSLNKKAADNLTEIFLTLYSKENKKAWEQKNLEGLSRFLGEEFVCTWKGFSVWDAGNGTVDCHYRAEITLSPTENIIKDKGLEKLLKKNPFMTKESIHKYFEEAIYKYLSNEFEEYCTCDDYYQPVVEDFEIDYYITEWSGKNGFEVVSCEGDGDDGGYEPKVRKGWY